MCCSIEVVIVMMLRNFFYFTYIIHLSTHFYEISSQNGVKIFLNSMFFDEGNRHKGQSNDV